MQDSSEIERFQVYVFLFKSSLFFSLVAFFLSKIKFSSEWLFYIAGFLLGSIICMGWWPINFLFDGPLYLEMDQILYALGVSCLYRGIRLLHGERAKAQVYPFIVLAVFTAWFLVILGCMYNISPHREVSLYHKCGEYIENFRGAANLLFGLSAGMLFLLEGRGNMFWAGLVDMGVYILLSGPGLWSDIGNPSADWSSSLYALVSLVVSRFLGMLLGLPLKSSSPQGSDQVQNGK